MAEEEEDKEAKTEEPSQRKLEEALERGQVINSREVNNAFTLVVLTAMLAWVLPMIFKHSAVKLKILIENAGTINLDQGQVWNVMTSLLTTAFLSISPLLLLIIVSVFFANYMQHGQFTFSFEALQFNPSRISLIGGIKRIFSQKSLVDLVKNLAKVTILGIFLYLIVSSDIQALRVYQDMAINTLVGQFHNIIDNVMICAAIFAIILAVLDYSYQRYEYFQSLKMTKHEVKEERKQTEGDPLIKKRIREIRMSRAKHNIKKNVLKADVIITNPTHYSIAIRYDQSTMNAPMVVAKGLDLIALMIRELAQENDIPIVENPPLARALYKIDEMEYIPEQHYEAVAKIMGYVYYLNERRGKKTLKMKG
jgi:flagellar biosynthetic protein FlhB